MWRVNFKFERKSNRQLREKTLLKKERERERENNDKIVSN